MNRFFSRSVLTIALFLAAAPCFAGVPVTLKPTVDVNKPAIRLADVFEGVTPELDRDIAISPAPGKSVTYDIRVLSKLAEQYRLDWQPQSSSDKAILTRASTQITQEMIAEAVLQKLKETQKMDKSNTEVQFDNRNLVVHLPADKAPDFTVSNFSYDARAHRFKGDVVAQVNGQPVEQPVYGRVVVKKSMPVLNRRLVAGTTIGDSDLTWITVSDDQINPDMITQSAQIVGQELRHDQAEGEVLRTRDLMPPRLVARGALVTLKVETPMMQITAQGRAMQDGTKGDVVRVTNIQSNRVVEGVVEASGVIRVGSFRKLASAQ